MGLALDRAVAGPSAPILVGIGTGTLAAASSVQNSLVGRAGGASRRTSSSEAEARFAQVYGFPVSERLRELPHPNPNPAPHQAAWTARRLGSWLGLGLVPRKLATIVRPNPNPDPGPHQVSELLREHTPIASSFW